jgi:hypothetical protein
MCLFYARKWPRGEYPNVEFGHFDDIWGGYKDQGHLVYGSQRFNPDSMPSCHPDTQSRTNPITLSYAPSNHDYGPMVRMYSHSIHSFFSVFVVVAAC